MVSSGDYVRPFPEDGVPTTTDSWSVSKATADRRVTTASAARGTRPGLWLRQPVAAHLPQGWMHGQVVDVAPTGVQVRHGDEISDCATTHLIKTGPIISLLLWDAVTPHGHRASKIRQNHVQLLDKLLGHIGNRQLKPSRDMAVILAGIIPDEEIPSPDTVRSRVDMSTGMQKHFPLQHAVDFVCVSDSHARRILKSIRDSIGASFCSPPTRGPYDQASTPTGAEAASQDSFYDAESASIASDTAENRQGPVDQPSTAPANPNAKENYHARIVRALASQPDLLLAYLDGIDTPAEPSRKRQRIDLHQAYDDLNKASKYAFRPTPHQAAVHELLVPPRKQFAPHPGVLIRLYDFQFGMRGLSIMHVGFTDRVSKMVWVKSRKANMQNFSRTVAVPEAQAPSSVDDITAALSSLQTYCTTFMSTEVGDLVHSLRAFVQQEIPKIWPAEDLQHFGFWIDGVLEAFREAAVHDLHGGDETRRTIQATVARNNPDFQATVQLLTQRRLQDLLRHGPLLLQPRQASRTRVVEAAETGRRRQDQSRYRPASRDAPNHLQHVPAEVT
ncbi:hypothetical protein PI124_g21592 [Phytophthora idaei]|nr:hypothetical protein PI124_g21592 [Phytophthora idaei]